MNLLAIDTTTELASIALSINGCVYYKEQLGVKTHAHEILPIINELLDTANGNLQQLNGIAFGCGPGSFTGVRVACSVAKGLAYGLDVPIYPVSSLRTIVYGVKKSQFNILAALDARMNQVYWSYNTASMSSQECVNNMEDIILPSEYANAKCYLAGVGWQNYINTLPNNIKNNIIDSIIMYPKADTMLDMINNSLIQAVDALQAEPVYVRNNITQE